MQKIEQRRFCCSVFSLLCSAALSLATLSLLGDCKGVAFSFSLPRSRYAHVPFPFAITRGKSSLEAPVQGKRAAAAAAASTGERATFFSIDRPLARWSQNLEGPLCFDFPPPSQKLDLSFFLLSSQNSISPPRSSAGSTRTRRRFPSRRWRPESCLRSSCLRKKRMRVFFWFFSFSKREE